MPVSKAVLQIGRPIKGITVLYDPMIEKTKGVANRLIPVPLKDIPIGPAIETIKKVPFLIKHPIAENKRCLLFVKDIIPYPQTGLQLMIDQQGNTGIIIGHTPVIGMR